MRPPAVFVLERLEQLGDDQLVYRFSKPQPDGRAELPLTPLELIDRLATLIPPPRLHRHRYHGVPMWCSPKTVSFLEFAARFFAMGDGGRRSVKPRILAVFSPNSWSGGAMYRAFGACKPNSAPRCPLPLWQVLCWIPYPFSDAYSAIQDENPGQPAECMTPPCLTRAPDAARAP